VPDDPAAPLHAAAHAFNAASAAAWHAGHRVAAGVYVVPAPDGGPGWPVVQVMVTRTEETT
jgi:hypothetical protein